MRVYVVCCCAYTLVHLTLDVPFFPFILRRLRGQVDVLDVKDHLDTDIPEFFLQLYKEKVLVSALLIEPIHNSSLLRRAEWTRFCLYHWVTTGLGEMKALILVAGRLEVN